MGLNAPCIQRVIHCRPPTTMEKCMQEIEIGRAGRNGQEAEAIMFCNMSDVSKSRKRFTTAVREFCLLENKCYRKELLNYMYFGFNNMMYNGDRGTVYCCYFIVLLNECFNIILYFMSKYSHIESSTAVAEGQYDCTRT